MLKFSTNLRGLFFLFASLMSFSTFAQTIVSGKIMDGKNNTAVNGASVSVQGTNEGTLTNTDGQFKLETKQKPPFKVSVSFVGFNSQVFNITKANTTLSVELAEANLSLEEVVVSASRRAEKVQDAPASVSILSAKMMLGSSAIDPVRELINVPGVQIQQQSAARINIEMRGSAGLFGTGVFPIMDYRSLVGPGIGTFQSDAVGLNSLDLSRIEVVRGPGSALYGPGVTAGVVHFITKSAIDNPGTSIELLGGELSTFGASIRHAYASKDKKFGFKINAHYKKGDEFTLNASDPADAKQIAKFKKSVINPALTNGVVDVTKPSEILLNQAQLDPDGDGNMMQNYWWNNSINGTFEFRPSQGTKILLSGGYNRSSSVFYNSQGEGLSQSKEYWTQLRFQKKGFFAQVFYVDNDGGGKDNPTFLYQTGSNTSLGRKQLEGQVQYNFALPKFLNADITVGSDYRNAASNTNGLVYGRNENDDDFTMYGAYAQGKFGLSNKIDMVLATRYDQFNFIDKGAFSPRIAFVYKASPNHTFRASYNNSSSPPSALELNIDFPVSTPVPGLFDVWLRGNKTGQNFSASPMIDLTAPGFPDLPFGTPGLPLAIPYGAVTPAVLKGLQAGLPAATYGLIAALLTNPANVPKGVSGQFQPYNLFTGQPLQPINAPAAILQTNETFEIGYKGTFNKKLTVSADFYRVHETGFRNFTAISPTIRYANQNIAVDLSTAVQTTLLPQITAALVAQGLSQAAAAATAAQLAGAVAGAYSQAGTAFATQIAPLSPIFGAVETDGVPVDGQVHSAAGYRTYGNSVYYGIDLGLNYEFNKNWSGFFNYSALSQNEFTAEDLGEATGSGLNYFLNVPKSKYRFGVNYFGDKGFRGNMSFQHDDAFFASLGQFSGITNEKNLVDAGLGYKLKNGIAIDLTCTNLFDSKYRAFVNMPNIGRRAIVKLTIDIK